MAEICRGKLEMAKTLFELLEQGQSVKVILIEKPYLTLNPWNQFRLWNVNTKSVQEAQQLKITNITQINGYVLFTQIKQKLKEGENANTVIEATNFISLISNH